MNLKTKKIIAREFLVFIISLSIGIIAFLGTYVYNSFYQRQIDNINQQISAKELLADSISNAYFKTPTQEPMYRQYYRYNNALIKVSNEIDALKNSDELNRLVSKKLNFDNQLHFGFIVFLISIFVLFIIRYVFYGIKWSIRTIKQ
jgi:hypothetical protein